VLDNLLLALATLRAAGRRHADLVLENLLSRHQLAVLTRPTRRRRRVAVRRLDKVLWVLMRCVRRDWRRHLVVVTPETVLRWHRRGRRRYRWWRSGRPAGRPRVPSEVRALIRRLSEEL
jgi:putative transposase